MILCCRIIAFVSAAMFYYTGVASFVSVYDEVETCIRYGTVFQVLFVDDSLRGGIVSFKCFAVVVYQPVLEVGIRLGVVW